MSGSDTDISTQHPSASPSPLSHEVSEIIKSRPGAVCAAGRVAAVYTVLFGLSLIIIAGGRLVHMSRKNQNQHCLVHLIYSDKFAVTVFLLLPRARIATACHFMLREQGPMTTRSSWNTGDWFHSKVLHYRCFQIRTTGVIPRCAVNKHSA